jgi:hypothetical protein
MPIQETFKMPEHLLEHTPTPTEDEDEDHDSSVQIIEHKPVTPPHVLLSDDELLSFTAALAAAIEVDLGGGSVHDHPHGQGTGKEVMVDAPTKKVSKKKLREMKKELKRAMAEATTESPDESISMHLDIEDAPQRGKEQDTSARRRSGRRGDRIQTDPYLQPEETHDRYHMYRAQQEAILRSYQSFPFPYHPYPPAAYSPTAVYCRFLTRIFTILSLNTLVIRLLTQLSKQLKPNRCTNIK